MSTWIKTMQKWQKALDSCAKKHHQALKIKNTTGQTQMVGQLRPSPLRPRLLRRLYSLESEDTLASALPAIWPPQARGASLTFLERRVMPPRQAKTLPDRCQPAGDAESGNVASCQKRKLSGVELREWTGMADMTRLVGGEVGADTHHYQCQGRFRGRTAGAMTSYDGPTTPKGQLMRDVYRGLAGFCSVDAQAMAKGARSGDRTPYFAYLVPNPRPWKQISAEDSAPVAQSGHEGVGIVGLASSLRL